MPQSKAEIRETVRRRRKSLLTGSSDVRASALAINAVQVLRDFDLTCAGFPHSSDGNAFASMNQQFSPGGASNRTAWNNATVGTALKAYKVAKTDAERYEIYQKMDALLVEELPVLPIYYYTSVKALSPRVKGYESTLLDSHPYKYIWLEPAGK